MAASHSHFHFSKRTAGNHALALLLLSLALSAHPLLAQPSARLRTLTTAKAAHDISLQEADRAHPVHLRATVTIYDPHLAPNVPPSFFVSDASGGVYVSIANLPRIPYTPGDLVEIFGVTARGLYAPIVDHTRVRVLGRAPLPAKAPRIGPSDMLTGQYDGQWVEVQGLVHDVRESPTHVVLDLLLGDSSTTAITVRQPHVDYAHLVDSAIVLHAIVAPKFNAEYQLTGAHLLFPGLQSLTVTHAGAGDSFSLPPDEIDTLLRFTPGGTLNHRIHVRGAVTLDWPGRMICIQNGVHRLCATTSQRSEVTAGELVDLVGFPALGAFTPTLLEAKYHPRGQTVPILAKTVTASEALQGHNDIRLVTIEGRIIDLGRQRGDQILTISSGGLLFTSTLPDSNPAADSQTTLETLAVGSRVRVTGICSIQAAASSEDVGEASSVPQSFRILQRSAADIVVLQRPSWWNVERSLRMLGGALTLVLLALATIIFLRLRIRQQTATIRAQLTETAALKDAAEYQAMHDSLTGIYNRKAIFAALGREFDLAARSGSTTGVLMVDIDHFKQINDTHGHAAGDHVIQQSVQRILSAIRSTDLLGRYGGEEFLVVLTLCEREQVRACSERIRESLAASPIVFGGKSIFVTASVGAVAASYSLLPKRDAVAAADLALYEAKHGGRNCVAFHDLYAPSHTEVLIDRS